MRPVVPSGARAAAIPAAAALALLLAGCPGAQTNFSQHPGFARYFARHPAPPPPGPRDRALLERHRPRLHLPAGHEGPIDFYRDYVAPSVLRPSGGGALDGGLDRRSLAAHARDPGAVLEHRRGAPAPRPVAYARIRRERIPGAGGPAAAPHVFLTYHFVFRVSGLPAGLAPWQALALGAVADLDDWHQLDHYTAATVVLDGDERPYALVLQQHNYQRTYLLGEGVARPPDGRVALDVALRSNELYPHRAGRVRRRAVRFLGPDELEFLMGFGSRPWLAADDVTEPAREAAYSLEYLPGDDPFYRFEGFLGERRLLPGRDGPPGADYNTLPRWKPWPVALPLGYFREGDAGDVVRLRRALDAGEGLAGFARRQMPVLAANRDCLARARRGCRLR